MRLSLLLLLCGLCFSVAYSSFSNAADYQWTPYLFTPLPTRSTPTEACNDLKSSCDAQFSSGTRVSSFLRLSKQTETTFNCVFQIQSQDSNGDWQDLRASSSCNGYTAKATRSGTSCPPGTIYNPENGVCAVPPPTPDDCLAGGPGIFAKSGPVISSNGNNYVAVAGGGSVCFGQCTHSLSDRAASCYGSGEGTGFCNYVGTPTGDICSESDAPLGRTGDPLNPPDTSDVPPSDPNDPGCPPGYGWSGTTCAKNPDDNGNPPGDGSGGDGGDTGGGDGSGGDGGDTGGGGGGDNGGGDGSGGDGGDTGGGDGSGGDGGTGSQPGEGSGDEGEDPSSSVGGESCSATITCEGDAIQCAILRSQKKQACADEEARDYSKAAPTINAEIGKGEYQLKEETVDASGFFNMGNRFYSSTCPSPKSLRIESFNRTIQLSYQPLCDFAGALSYIVVAMASLFFMVYVGRSFGGE